MARFSIEKSPDGQHPFQQEEDSTDIQQGTGRALFGARGDPVIRLPSEPHYNPPPPSQHHHYEPHIDEEEEKYNNDGSADHDQAFPRRRQVQHHVHQRQHNREAIHRVDDVVQELDNVLKYLKNFQTETFTRKTKVESPKSTRMARRRVDHEGEVDSRVDGRRRGLFTEEDDDDDRKMEHTISSMSQRKIYRQDRNNKAGGDDNDNNNSLQIDLTGIEDIRGSGQQVEQLTPTTATDNTSSLKTRDSFIPDVTAAAAVQHQEHDYNDIKNGMTTPAFANNMNNHGGDNPEESSWEELKALLRSTESVLQSSPDQRESARSWATAMRKSVLKWVKEQHTLIECERKRFASEMEEAESCRQLQNMKFANDLTSTIQHLKSELQTESMKHKQTIQQLDTIIHRQKEKIQFLEEELVNTRHELLQANNEKKQQSPTSVANFQSPNTKTESSQHVGRTTTASREHEYDKYFRPTSTTPRTRNQPTTTVDPLSPSPIPNDDRHHHHQSPVSPPQQQFHEEDATTRIPRRVEKVFPDGLRIVHYRNGSKKEVYPDGKKILYFNNGDVKTVFADDSGIISYYYASTKTTHKMDPKGVDIYEYPNDQVEIHYTDGRKKIQFPDGTVKKIFCDGTTETTFNDGIQVLEYPDGTKVCVRF